MTFKNVVQTIGSGTAVMALGAASVGDLVVVGIGSPNAGNPGSEGVTDNAGNTYTRIGGGGRNNGVAGVVMYRSILTTGNAALSVTATPSSGTIITGVAWILSGVASFNNDAVSEANFSGSSTAFSVGPSSPAPSGSSVFFYGLSAPATESPCPDPSGWNTTGVNGFTSGMLTAAHQETFSTGTVIPCIMGYIIASSAQTAALTLPVASSHFGWIASFLLTDSSTIVPGNSTQFLDLLGVGT